MKSYPYELQHTSRNDQRLDEFPMWKIMRIVNQGDPLAYRWLILRVHGRETLINIIRGHHGLPNRY